MTRALLLLLALGLVGCGERDAYWRGYADGVRQSRAITDAFTLGYSAAQEHGKERAMVLDTLHNVVWIDPHTPLDSIPELRPGVTLRLAPGVYGDTTGGAR